MPDLEHAEREGHTPTPSRAYSHVPLNFSPASNWTPTCDLKVAAVLRFRITRRGIEAQLPQHGRAFSRPWWTIGLRMLDPARRLREA